MRGAASLPLPALVLATAAMAAEDAPVPPEPVPAAQALPAQTVAPPFGDQEEIEPEVTIIQRKDRTVEEYRVNGQLYMIKVKPAKGPEYVLVDTDGDGNLETRSSNLEPNLLIPGWVIFRW